MTCREFIEFLWRYLSDELPMTERAHFDEHLKECPNCVHYMQSYKDTIKIGKVALAPTDEPVPADVPEELIQAILSSRPRPS
jgi:anti-sigma factor RsiW